jgi:putative aminopeptidase FrvX
MMVGVVRGGSPATQVMAHMDELSMLVKRVKPDGTLHLTQLGTMYPGKLRSRSGRHAR